MTDRITAGLARLFDEHRIVFWYDTAQDMRAAYEAADLPGVEKVEIANNEFGLKYRMLSGPGLRTLFGHHPALRDPHAWSDRAAGRALQFDSTYHERVKKSARRHGTFAAA